MFKKNKRREESTYLSIENGEVKTFKENELTKNKINARVCDNFSEEEIENSDLVSDIEIKNGLPVCKPIYDDITEMEEDSTVLDMKATIFNIFKFIFIFCFIAIIGVLIYKTAPIVIESVKEFSNSEDINNSNSNSDTNEDLNFIEKQKIEKEKKKLIETMNNMNTINNQIRQNWVLLQNYCLNYSNNTYTIYTHEKNMISLETQFSNEFLNFLNTEQSFETDYDKSLFEFYKLRYQNLMDCMTILKDSNSYNRSSIIDKINEYVLIDNEYNEKEFDILIENLNTYNLSYTITDTEIILNE